MKYVGSKNRLSKEILPIILKNRKPNQYYIEPFCGGCNLIDKVDDNRIANDSNSYLIEMFKGLVNDFCFPSKITNEEYNYIKNNKDDFPKALVGFVGFGCSYSGKWFGGYARDKHNMRNYCDESKRNILNQKEKLKGVIFSNKSYLDLEIPDNSIVYCDPPYRDTVKYNGTSKFNHDEFWDWVRKISLNNKVFVSEYSAPDDFICLFSKKVNNTLVKNTGSKQGIERLFKMDSIK